MQSTRVQSHRFGLLPSLLPAALLAAALQASAVRAGHANPAAAETASVETALIQQAPSIDRNVLHLALGARANALRKGLLPRPNVLTVIDYSRPSVEPRLWVFDLATNRLLYRELVAHGKNTGDNLARAFSNDSRARAVCCALMARAPRSRSSTAVGLRRV